VDWATIDRNPEKGILFNWCDYSFIFVIFGHVYSVDAVISHVTNILTVSNLIRIFLYMQNFFSKTQQPPKAGVKTFILNLRKCEILQLLVTFDDISNQHALL